LDYLTQELVPLALFDPNLTDEDKNKLAHTLISTTRPTEFAVGKPKPPTINWRPDDQPSLSDLIGDYKYSCFDIKERESLAQLVEQHRSYFSISNMSKEAMEIL
jgi:hypothetical protein